MIGTRIPADVYQGVELGSNGGRRGGNDGQVEEKEIVCHGGARQDRSKPEACRIVVTVLAIVGGILARSILILHNALNIVSRRSMGRVRGGGGIDDGLDRERSPVWLHLWAGGEGERLKQGGRMVEDSRWRRRRRRRRKEKVGVGVIK